MLDRTDVLLIHLGLYCAGSKQRDLEREETGKMQQVGMAEPAITEWSSPVMFVPKENYSLQFCAEYCCFNTAAVREKHSIPRVDECIGLLGEDQMFSTLDSNSSYWQIKME